MLSGPMQGGRQEKQMQGRRRMGNEHEARWYARAQTGRGDRAKGEEGGRVCEAVLFSSTGPGVDGVKQFGRGDEAGLVFRFRLESKGDAGNAAVRAHGREKRGPGKEQKEEKDQGTHDIYCPLKRGAGRLERQGRGSSRGRRQRAPASPSATAALLLVLPSSKESCPAPARRPSRPLLRCSGSQAAQRSMQQPQQWCWRLGGSGHAHAWLLGRRPTVLLHRLATAVLLRGALALVGGHCRAQLVGAPAQHRVWRQRGGEGLCRAG